MSSRLLLSGENMPVGDGGPSMIIGILMALLFGCNEFREQKEYSVECKMPRNSVEAVLVIVNQQPM
jgi:hypothetical protein